MLASQEQAASETPSPEEPEQERLTADTDSGKKQEESNQEPQLPSTPEERRHNQRERLNQILLNLLEKIPGKNGKTQMSEKAARACVCAHACVF